MFEYRVMYQHHDGKIVAFASGLTEETAEMMLNEAKRREDTREWWTERRCLNPWEKVS